jgi:acyl carrier protein
MNIKGTVRDFITKTFYVPDVAALSDDASFLDKGILDSTSVLELTTFLETTFGIEIKDDELVPENLDSLANVESFVKRKIDGRGARSA